MFTSTETLQLVFSEEIKKLTVENKKYQLKLNQFNYEIYQLEHQPIKTEGIVDLIMQDNFQEVALSDENLFIDHTKLDTIKNEKSALIQGFHNRYLMINSLISAMKGASHRANQDELRFLIKVTVTLTKFLKNKATKEELLDLASNISFDKLNHTLKNYRLLMFLTIAACILLLTTAVVFSLIWAGVIATAPISLPTIVAVCLTTAIFGAISGIVSGFTSFGAFMEKQMNSDFIMHNCLTHLDSGILPNLLALQEDGQKEHMGVGPRR